MKTTYPTSFDEIDGYARRVGVDASVARQRFAQYGLLRALSCSRELSSSLALKGGNALSAFWIPNRSTKDLDFSFKRAIAYQALQSALQGTFKRVRNELDITYQIIGAWNNSDENPPRGPEFQIIRIKVAYALRYEFELTRRLEASEGLPRDSSNFVDIEIASGECVCETVPVGVDGQFDLQVCSLEDIMAEKLRSLLQQITRKTGRRQDVLDLAIILQPGTYSFDVEKVSKFLREKAPLRGVNAIKSEFMRPEVMEQARLDYDELRETAKVFIPFDTAFAAVMTLVESLSIPE